MNWLDHLKWTTFKDGLKYFRSDWTEKVHSTWFLTEIYRYLSWIENSQVLFLSLKIDTVLQFANNSGQTTASGQFLSQRYHRDVHVCKSLVTYNSSLFIYYRVYLGSQENRALLEEVEIREIVDPRSSGTDRSNRRAGAWRTCWRGRRAWGTRPPGWGW